MWSRWSISTQVISQHTSIHGCTWSTRANTILVVSNSFSVVLPLFCNQSTLILVDIRHSKHLGRSIHKLKLFFYKLLKCYETWDKMLIIVHDICIVWTLLIWIDMCLWFEMIFMNIGLDWTWILWELILNDWNYFVKGLLNLFNIWFDFVFIVIKFGLITFEFFYWLGGCDEFLGSYNMSWLCDFKKMMY